MQQAWGYVWVARCVKLDVGGEDPGADAQSDQCLLQVKNAFGGSAYLRKPQTYTDV